MDRTAVLEAMEAWTVEERIEFIGDIWDQLAASGYHFEHDPALWAEIERRRAEHLADPTSYLTREEYESRRRRS